MILILAFDKGSILNNHRKGNSLRIRMWTLAWIILGLLTSCNSKKYLSGDQSFLKDNKITIKSKYKISDKADLKEKLATLYRQNQTRVIAGIPRHTFYYQYQERLR